MKGIYYKNAPISKLIQGKKSEDLFKKIILENNFEYKKSSKMQDIYQHTDCFVKFHSKFRSIDVKSIKKLKGEFQDDRFYIEIKNDYGIPGWLYSNDVNFIAFQTFEGFDIYKTKKLRKYYESNKNALESASKKDSPAQLYLIERKKIKNLLYKNLKMI